MHGEHRHQIETLKDKTDALTPDQGARPLRQATHLAIIQMDGTLVRHIQQPTQIEQGTLATPRRPHQRHEIAVAHLEVDATQGRYDVAAEMITFLDAFQGKQHAP